MIERTDKEILDWLSLNSYAFVFRHDTGKGFINLSTAYDDPFNLRGAVTEAMNRSSVETPCPSCDRGLVGKDFDKRCCHDCEGTGRALDISATVLRGSDLMRVRGQHLRDAGKQKVAKNNTYWLRWIRAEAERIANVRGHVAVDELRWYADHCGRQPSHPNTWGCVFDEKSWIPCGEKQSQYHSHRGRRIKIWRLK